MFKLLSGILSKGSDRKDQTLSRGRSARHPFSILRLLGRYDAAVTTDDNRRHWAAADGLSANAANSREVRRTLRNRARYEVANNSYARGIVLTLANDVIGTGPRLQILSPDGNANRGIEQAFQQWAKAVDLPGKLRTMRMARATDGESFAILTSNSKLTTTVQLDLRLVEADQVCTPDLVPGTANSVDGVVFDADGNTIEYHVLRKHPGDGNLSLQVEYDRLPAESVLHWFRMDRPGQARGIPDIMPALPLFAQLRRFTLAVLAAAETAADFAGILYTDAPAGGEADAAEPFEAIELEKRALITMPGGWKMAQMQAEQPATTYAEFKRELLNEIARCLNMPYNVAAANSSGYNYASGRLDFQTYYKSIRVEQSHIETVILDRLLAAWLDEAALVPDLLPSGLGPIATWSHQWFWDGHEHVDPAKEANAQSIRLASNTTTLAYE
ncbi:MAG: phage portal protein, partial [Pirellula sp.]